MRITTKTKNLLKKVGLILLCVIAVGFVASAIVGADDSEYKRVYLTWDVGGIDESGYHIPDEKGSIYTVKALECSDILLAADFNSDISYSVYFYDEAGEFISMVSNDGKRELEIPNGEFPNSAVSVRIVITPLNDENGKIGLFEKYTYANQLTVKLRTADAE